VLGSVIKLGAQGMIQPEVMQTTGNFHDHIVKARAQVAENVSHNAKDLDCAQRVLNADAHAGDSSVMGFVLSRQLEALGVDAGCC